MKSPVTRSKLVLMCLLAFTLVGCSGRPARLQLADIDYGAAAHQAVSEYDTDGDSSLSRNELEKSPALLAAFARIDGNQDSVLSEAEITDYLRRLQEAGVAMVSWTLQIQIDGKPLQGATVKLLPAEFLGPSVLPAEGVTDKNGLVTLAVDEKHRPTPHAKVVQCGLYSVLVSKRSGDGEVVPDRYATNTTLGLEVRPEGQADYSGAVINLSGG